MVTVKPTWWSASEIETTFKVYCGGGKFPVRRPRARCVVGTMMAGQDIEKARRAKKVC